MAEKPQFIASPFPAVIKLTNQTGTRSGTPAAGGLIFTAGGNGSLIESILAVPLGTNVATNLFLYEKSTGGTYYLIGSINLPATTAPSAGDNTGMLAVDCSGILPQILFPAATTDVYKKGRRVPPSWEVYVNLDVAVASGYTIVMNGGNY